jgi:uncharacterized protein (TIGR03663 family)
MNRFAFACVMVFALAIALAFRLAAPDLRPVHHDEANQAVKFGTLLETGEYQYDRADHHGPTLYYLTLPAAWARGQSTLASLDEQTLRVVPAVFGAGLILLFLLLGGGLGRVACAAAALLCALSPVLTYYSRFYIQESLLAFFALGFLIALGRYVQRPTVAMACWAGVCAGLAYATKETSVIVLPAAVAAAVVAHRSTRALGASAGLHGGQLAAGTTAALAVAFVFYSSFFRHPSGLFESVRAFSTYIDRGVAAGAHTQPWDYYLRLLSFSSSGGLVWTEGLVLTLALVGLFVLVRQPGAGFWPRYVALYSMTTAVAFSTIRYKTPWNVLPFYIGFVLLAGQGVAALVGSARSRVVRGLVAVVLLAAAWQLGAQNWRANFRYPADPRNPYVYAQTSPDFLRLARRMTDVAAVHPDQSRMLVKVVAGPYEQWPLPWYLRRMTRVGYWSRAAEAGRLDDVPVIIASQENTGAVDTALGDRYVSEFYGLRPDVLLTVYIDRTLWSHFLK